MLNFSNLENNPEPVFPKAIRKIQKNQENGNHDITNDLLRDDIYLENAKE